MKKWILILGILIGSISFAGQRVTIKKGSYCTGLIEYADMYDGYVDINELYLFKKCVINGKTYQRKITWGDGEYIGVRLRIYFNSIEQMSDTSDKITAYDRVYFKSGETMVKESDDYETIWEINVKKIEIK